MSQGAQKEFGEALGCAANGVTIQASWHPLANFTGMLNGKEFTNQMFLDAFKAKYGCRRWRRRSHPLRAVPGHRTGCPRHRLAPTTPCSTTGWLPAPQKTRSRPSWAISTGMSVVCRSTKSFIMTQWQDGKLEFVYPTDAFPGVKSLRVPKADLVRSGFLRRAWVFPGTATKASNPLPVNRNQMMVAVRWHS